MRAGTRKTPRACEPYIYTNLLKLYGRVTEGTVYECPDVVFVGVMVADTALPGVVLQQRLACCYADW